LVLLHIDGSDDVLPAHGDAVVQGGREIGWIASAAQHYELGPIATAVVKSRATDEDVLVRAASVEVSAAQERITA
jgi:folate-binding Fe-S cluster repair protein YgfZ